jgi:hypothetical protein
MSQAASSLLLRGIRRYAAFRLPLRAKDRALCFGDRGELGEALQPAGEAL